MPSIFLQTKHLRIIAFLLIAILSVGYYCVKFGGPHYTEALYQKGQFELLNRMTGGQGEEPLAFYDGRAKETLWGPLSQMIAGLVYILCVFLFLKNFRLKYFWLSIFLYLIATKLEILFYPPYGDAIGGPFVEAVWLAKHNFNYLGLWQENGYANGGPKVYMFSVYPTFLAICMRVIPSIKAFLCFNHLSVFALSATVVALTREILKRVFSKEVSALAAGFLLAVPLFQAQAEQINMEMPFTFFIVLAVYFLMNKKIHKAGIFTVCAVLVKGTAVFACAALALLSVFLYFFHPDFKRQNKLLCWGGVATLIGVLKVLSKFLINDQHVIGNMVKPFAGWPSIHRIYITYFYIASLLIFGVYYAFVKIFQARGKTPKLNWPQEAAGVRDFIIMAVYGGMWFALFINFFAVSPRYRLPAYPFLVYTGFYAFSLLVKNRVVRNLALCSGILFAAFSSYGYYYEGINTYDYVLMERSLEYRTDLELCKKIARAMEDKYSQLKIGAPFIHAQYLAMPEMGYVKKDLDIMIYGFYCVYEDIDNFWGLDKLDVRRTVYIGTDVVFEHAKVSYPIGPRDQIIDVIQSGSKKAYIFVGGTALDRVWKLSNIVKLYGMKHKIR